jgi:hypothetical protein
MPIYGLNSYILACKSDNLGPVTIATPAVTDQSQQLIFAFTGGQKFSTYSSANTVLSSFAYGYKVYVDSFRVTIPNYSGVACSNTTVGTTPNNALVYFNPSNGVDTGLTVDNIVSGVTVLNEWVPVNRTTTFNGNSTAWYFQPRSLVIDADFRNCNLTTFQGLTVYAYIELKINAINGPV